MIARPRYISLPCFECAVFEAIKCNAIYESRYLLGTSIARPCIAKEMVRIAREEGATYIAHGATGKGNDQVRFEMCVQALMPEATCVAPWRDAEFIESFKGRSDLLAYCSKHGIPVDAKPKANYSIDENLFHTSYESGSLEDAMCPPRRFHVQDDCLPQGRSRRVRDGGH